MYLNGAMMVILGYAIGYMFGQMNIKTELKEQGIVFQSKKPSLLSRIMDMFVGKAKLEPNQRSQSINQVPPSASSSIPQNNSQPQSPVSPPIPKNKNNINNYKNNYN